MYQKMGTKRVAKFMCTIGNKKQNRTFLQTLTNNLFFMDTFKNAPTQYN